MIANIILEKQRQDNRSLESSMFRKRIKVNELGTEDYIFKIAKNIEELESVYKLIHDIYVKTGYMNPCNSGLRLNYYNAAPYTQTFIGRKKNQTMITVTLIPDSILGIPADNLYKKEVDELRKKGRYVAEVGGLVSTLNNQNILMHIVKILYLYADKFLNIDDLIITINPKHRLFYEFALCFEDFGSVKNYPYVNDNPAIALRLDFHKYKELYRDIYPREPVENDLHHFFFEKKSSAISLPEKLAPLRVWNREMFNYFFKEKTNLYFETDAKIRNYLTNLYNLNRNDNSNYAESTSNIVNNSTRI